MDSVNFATSVLGGPGDALLTALASECAASKRAALETWLGIPAEAGAEVDDNVWAWISFALLGCVRDTTPWHWALALAEIPVSNDKFCKRHLTLVELLRWYVDDKTEWKEWKTEWETLASPALDQILRTLAADILPVAEWHLSTGPNGRDQCFATLRHRLSGGWTKHCWHDVRLRALLGLQRVSLRRLKEVETKTGVIVPGDLRRVLLEVGDVGKALFGQSILDSLQSTCAFADLVRDLDLDLDLDEELKSELVFELGYGGGYGNTNLILQMSGTNRGRVLVCQEDDNTGQCTLTPLRGSKFWVSLSGFYGRASEVFLVLCRAAGLPLDRLKLV